MAIGTGHRSNNYTESKRNDHLDNNRRQEQRNKGIPNKSHPNFREEHKSFSSIFVSNIPWNASVQDLWDICNKWGVVIDVYIAAKRSKSGHRFGFVRFINVNDINQLVSNLRTAWMGGFHLFADVAKYGRTYNRPVERSGDGKPSVGSNSQSVSINENVFQSFNSYAKAVLGNKSVDMSGKYGTSNAGAESVGVSDCNKVYKEAGNDAVMSITASETYVRLRDSDDVGLMNTVWGNLGFVNSTLWIKERCVCIDLWFLQLQQWAPDVYKKIGWVGGEAKACLRIYSPKNVNNDSVSPSSRVLREEDVRGVESDLVDSFEECEIRDDSVLYNDGCIKGLHGKRIWKWMLERFLEFILHDELWIVKEELSSDDFRRTVEAFIARQQKILRDEEFSPMVYIGS
ncbi:nucleotide-binding alpha-beta plait domain-containing protein [Tanacetum coccineum]